MAAPALAAAGIGALGSVVGGITGGKGAKKAAKAAQQTAAMQIAAAERNRDYQYSLNAPAIGHGNLADDRISALLNLGGNQAGAEAAFDSWRDSTGYQTVLDEALRATNNGSFAGGAGISGANLRRLQETGAGLADRTFNSYVGHLGGVSAGGANARGLVAGVGANATNQMIGAYGASGAAQGNAHLASSANTQNMIQNLINAGLFAYGSSYGGGRKAAVAPPPRDPATYYGVPH